VSARAYRVAPRRRTRGRPASRIHWDKLGRVVLVLVLFVILFSYINPAVNFVDAWRDSHAQRSQLQRLQHQHSRLAAKAASLDDPSAAVEAARKLGMVAPDEHSFVIRGLHSAPSE
jgi:cell division protein FtsB